MTGRFIHWSAHPGLPNLSAVAVARADAAGTPDPGTAHETAPNGTGRAEHTDDERDTRTR
ncbi:hypothetical protein [Nocardiopsis sp. FR26]|uniref:hypothetical protein n=1 Tax=Nocardiopsis sp. FR26 TaxID=2605987 RepID=UPI00135C75C9|nr:hypothetical protein [Nocardiopsis sp. FR26]